MSAKWKTISEFPNYEVSQDGHVRSKGRWCTHNLHGTRFWKKGKILTPGRRRGGKLAVNIPQPRLVHRLVALAWIGPPPFEGAYVLHWDDDPINNHCKNLRWGSQLENMADAKRNGIKLGARDACRDQMGRFCA